MLIAYRDLLYRIGISRYRSTDSYLHYLDRTNFVHFYRRLSPIF